MNQQQRTIIAPLHGINILLVEDSDMNRLVAATMLNNNGATVHEAVNGLLAVEAMNNIPCDLVLMDIQMPVMDGRQATRMIRNSDHPNIPIIALTANAAKEETDKCLAAGMSDCIAKPFEEEDLVKLIGKWLGKDLPPLHEACAGKPLYSLEKLQHTGRDNPDFVQKMIRLFMVQIPAGVREIRMAHDAGNFDVLAVTVHRIEPILNNFCIGTLKQKIDELQSLALTHRPSPRLEELINDLDLVTAQIVDDLKFQNKTI